MITPLGLKHISPRHIFDYHKIFGVVTLRFGSTRAAPDAALLGDVGVPGTESVDMTPSSRSSVMEWRQPDKI
jgi:hypothetical protein